MNQATASLSELRTDFRSVRRKLKRHGQVTVTENGEPAFRLEAVAPPPAPPAGGDLPDYYARVAKRQPRAMSAAETQKFHAENRGDC